MNAEITIPAQSVTIPSQEVTVNIPTAQIVYQNSWLNQTTALSLTDIFTPLSESLYRVTAGVFVHGTSGNGEVDGMLSVPGYGALAFQGTYTSSSSPSQVSSPATAIMGGITGTIVQLLTSLSGSVSYYDLYVTIEQL